MQIYRFALSYARKPIKRCKTKSRTTSRFCFSVAERLGFVIGWSKTYACVMKWSKNPAWERIAVSKQKSRTRKFCF